MATPTQYETQLLSQGVTQSFIDAERAKGKSGLLGGVNVDPQDMERILSGFKASGSPYSADNITASVTNPLAPPNLNDPYGLQASIYAKSGVTEAQTPYLDAVAKLREFDQGSLNQQNTIESELNPLGVIRGEQADQARLRSSQRQGMAATADTLQSAYLAKKEVADQQYQVALNERATLTGLINSNPGAKITYSDTPTTAAAKIESYRVVQEKQAKKDAEEAKKDAYKSALKASLLDAGLKTKGNTKELEKRLRKYNKSAVADAKKLADLEYKTKLKAYNKPDGDGKDLVVDKTDKGVATIIEEGVNSGDDWGTIAATLVNGGIGVSSGSFADKYLRFKFNVAGAKNPLP